MQNKRTILVVESDKYLREVYALSLEIEGYGVILAENREDALEKILNPTQNFPDCVVLDLEMPTVRGDVFLEVIRTNYKDRYDHLPLVLCLDFGSDVDSSLMSLNLYKPFSLKFFVETIGNALIPMSKVIRNQTVSSSLI